MVRKISRITSLVLILTILFTSLINTNVFSATTVGTPEELAKQAYLNLDPKAKEIFVQFMEEEANKGNDELLKNHKKYIDKNYKKSTKKTITPEQYNQIKQFNANLTNKSAVPKDIMKSYGEKSPGQIMTRAAFVLPTLPWAATYVLNALAAGIASLGSMITAGAIVSLISSLNVAAVLSSVWSSVEPYWTSIVNSFSSYFSGAASTINTVFWTLYVEITVYNFRGKIISAPLDATATNHVDITLLNKIRKGNIVEAYWGRGRYGVESLVLAVIDIPSGTIGKMTRYLNQYKKYNTTQNLTGYKAYLLWDSKRNKIKHVHVRWGSIAWANREYLRYYNKLNWKIFPFPLLRNDKYLNTPPYPYNAVPGTPNIEKVSPTDQLSKFLAKW